VSFLFLYQIPSLKPIISRKVLHSGDHFLLLHHMIIMAWLHGWLETTHSAVVQQTGLSLPVSIKVELT